MRRMHKTNIVQRDRFQVLVIDNHAKSAIDLFVPFGWLEKMVCILVLESIK